MTKSEERILARMRELVAGGTWEVVPSHSPTIRLTREVETPDYARERKYQGLWPLWERDTYTELLFITLVNRTVIRGYSPCPWVGRSDQVIPFWYADLILNAENPWDVIENWARIKDERKAGRS